MTITAQGGEWVADSYIGIIGREVDDAPTTTFEYATSSNMKNSHSYTDAHNVDEDLTSIPAYSGAWVHDKEAGVMCRFVIEIDSSALIGEWLDVASLRK